MGPPDKYVPPFSENITSPPPLAEHSSMAFCIAARLLVLPSASALKLSTSTFFAFAHIAQVKIASAVDSVSFIVFPPSKIV